MSRSHPISLLKSEWVTMIRAEAAHAEKNGKLTRKQMNLIYEEGWFKLFVPSIYGGRQMSLPDALQLEEALACADGSLGWVVTLCAGAGWFGGVIDQHVASKVFGVDKVCLAGSGTAGGNAEITEDGYLINGSWHYASGAMDATSFTVNCVVTENGVGVKDDKGNNKIMSFVLKASDVHVGNSWNAMGMTATGSQPFTVKNLAVSCAHAFEANVGQQVKGPLYYYPFRELAEATLAINMSGMCFNFIDLCENIFQERKRVGADAYTLRPRLHDSVDSYKQKLEQARQKLYYAADMSWQMCAAKNEVSPSVLYKVSAASFALTDVVRECVHALYQYCGLEAADRDSEINRVFRNIITAGQHGMLIGDGSR